jgi:hypothetical protein
MVRILAHADEKVGVVNNFLHSLFKQVDVFLKEKQVTQATGTYACHAYLETLLNYGPSANDFQLTAAPQHLQGHRGKNGRCGSYDNATWVLQQDIATYL